MSDQDFGKLLLQARTGAGKTQGDLASDLSSVGLKVTQSTISAWEGGRQMPGVTALADVADKLGKVLGRDAAAFLDAARLPRDRAEASNRNRDTKVAKTRDDMPDNVKEDIEPADGMWAINPGSLAMTSNPLILGMWKTRVTDLDPKETKVLWPLDVCDRYSIDTALRAFRKLGEAVGSSSDTNEVRHLAICRTDRGRDLISEYAACAKELKAYAFMKFQPAVSLGVQEGRLVCDVNNVCLDSAKQTDKVVALHDAMNALAPFIQWNTASILYDSKDGLRHNLYKNASETRDGMFREDIGLWRPRQEAFELDDALRMFDSALDEVLKSQTES